ADTTTNGGTSAFSTVTASASLSVSAVNDAPVLNASESLALNEMPENAGVPVNGSTADSTLVSALVGGISDFDTGAQQGIAVIGGGAQGTLWCSTDGGATWNQAAVSSTNALLLQSDARLYFQPATDVSGTLSDAITIRGWDQSAGTNGGRANIVVTGTGGSTPFSPAGSEDGRVGQECGRRP